MKNIVLASHNAGKLKELASYLQPLGYEVLPQADFQITEVAETGLSFVENALIKARHAAATTGLAALADDSGLCVDALNGAPGVYTARYAGATSAAAVNENLLHALQGVPLEQRTAQAHCVLVYLSGPTDPLPVICHGTWSGRILTEPTGHHGFGFDSIFEVAGYGCSAAELPIQDKNHLSHRAQALRQLVKALDNGPHICI